MPCKREAATTARAEYVCVCAACRAAIQHEAHLRGQHLSSFFFSSCTAFLKRSFSTSESLRAAAAPSCAATISLLASSSCTYPQTQLTNAARTIQLEAVHSLFSSSSFMMPWPLINWDASHTQLQLKIHEPVVSPEPTSTLKPVTIAAQKCCTKVCHGKQACLPLATNMQTTPTACTFTLRCCCVSAAAASCV